MITTLRSAGIWISGSHILLESLADREVWGIPGGAVEAGESIEQACMREHDEEIGLTLECSRLAIVHEHFWNDNGQDIREYGFYFIVVPLAAGEVLPDIISHEGHLQFQWHSLAELPEIDFVPQALQSYLSDLPDDTIFVSTKIEGA